MEYFANHRVKQSRIALMGGCGQYMHASHEGIGKFRPQPVQSGGSIFPGFVPEREPGTTTRPDFKALPGAIARSNVQPVPQ